MEQLHLLRIRLTPENYQKSLSSLSSRKEIFENSNNYYDWCLMQFIYNKKISYTEGSKKRNSKSWKRKIFWFNQSHRKSVNTNIGK